MSEEFEEVDTTWRTVICSTYCSIVSDETEVKNEETHLILSVASLMVLYLATYLITNML